MDHQQNQPEPAPVRCLDCPYVAPGGDVDEGERHAAALGHRTAIGGE